MNIVLVMGQPDEQGQQLINTLKSKGFSCVASKKADEIDQLGNHQGSVAVVFFDPKIAYKFYQENKFIGFSMFRILYVSKNPKVTPEVESKLNSISLKLYSPATLEKLVQDVHGFFDGGKVDNGIDIQFSAEQNLDKE